jgi:hypothetical protein
LSEPIAHLTQVGWVCLGPSEKKKVRDHDDMSALSFRAEECVPDEGLDMFVRSFSEETQVPGPIFGKATDPDDARSREECKIQARNGKFPLKESTEAYRKMEITQDKESTSTVRIPWRKQAHDLRADGSEVLNKRISTVEPKYLRKKGYQMSNLVLLKDFEEQEYFRQMEKEEILEDSWYRPWFSVVDKGRATTWDKPNQEFWNLWIKWLEGLKDLEQIQLNGLVDIGMGGRHSVYEFCVASTETLRTASYMRCESGEKIVISFLVSRTRVTPLNAMFVDLYLPPEVGGNHAKRWKHLSVLRKYCRTQFVDGILATMQPRRKWRSAYNVH